MSSRSSDPRAPQSTGRRIGNRFPGIGARASVHLVVLALIVVGLSLPGTANAAPTPASASDATAGITGVAAEESTIRVIGSGGTGPTDIDIYALGTEVDPRTFGEHDPAASVMAGDDGTYSASLPRFDDSGHDRLYDQFVAVTRENEQILGDPRHVDTLDFAPDREFDYPRASSKKGLQVEMTDDAEELGVQHAGINVAFNSIMRNGPGEDPAQVIPFDSNGTTYYFDANAVEQLDKQIKPLSDNGVLVNLILILYQDDDPTSAWPVLHHPDAAVGQGTVYAFNTKTAEGVAYFTAAMEFLADRYTRADQKYGRAVGYIVGNEVDAQWVWANSGDMDLDDFLTHYARSVRIAWQATQKYWRGARTYISLTHCWTTVCGENPDPDNPTRFYAGKDVIDRLNTLTKRTGDFGWNIAHHPYPENLGNPAFWNDKTALPGFDTPRITFENIEVLPRYLAQDELGYGGESRRIILSEQGCNTPDATEEAERLQAACYAYAYYKIRFLDSIDAFILHRHVDHKQEGGLRLGIWTWDDERSDPALPGKKKLSYEVFQFIDTARSLEVTDFAKDVIGIDDWADVIEGFDPEALAERTPPREVGVRFAEGPIAGRPLGTFETSDDPDGWRLSDNASGVRQETGDAFAGAGFLRTAFESNLPSWSTVAKTWKGAELTLDQPIRLGPTDRLALAIRVPELPDGLRPGGGVYAQIRAYGSDGRTVYGVARLDGGDPAAWTPLSLKLGGRDGVRELSKVKVWLRGDGNMDWKGAFELDDVRLVKSVSDAPGRINADLELDSVEPVETGSKVALTVTNHDENPIAHDLAVRDCHGVSVAEKTVATKGLKPGESKAFELEVTAFDPADPARPVLCFETGRTFLSEVIALRPAPPRDVDVELYGFDDGTTQGWQAGENVSEVAAVTSFANGPGAPYRGSHVLDAASPAVAPEAERTVFLEPDQPLDLSDARAFSLRFDCYGAFPASVFHARVRLHAGDEQLEIEKVVDANQWNELTLDVSEWSGRSAITRMEVTFWSTDWEYPSGWPPHFQIDHVGYYRV